MSDPLASFPRVRLATVPTPIEPLERLGTFLGCPHLFIKRDDCTGFAMGGNKVRQIEFHAGAAQSRNADTLITTGAVQSNHARVTAAAARRLGMRCILQREDRVPEMAAEYHESGNALLDELFGAEVVRLPHCDEAAADRAVFNIAERMRTEGGKPYVIPLGVNHPPLGALGYVEAAEELLAQGEELGVHFDTLVVASGSGNTHAGLLVGLRRRASSIRVLGVCVRRRRELQVPRVLEKVRRTAELLGEHDLVRDEDVCVTDDELGPGYGRMTPRVSEAIREAAQREGLLLDPVYTGKAMAGLASLARSGELDERQRVLFLHTGGQPALFAYRRQLVG